LTESRPITAIRVGEQRHRRDLGDIDGLAESIGDLGLLHPITVDQHGNLGAGARRLAACKKLGWTEIDVRVVRAV
jgi:ParB family chromosome partitioning protein